MSQAFFQAPNTVPTTLIGAVVLQEAILSAGPGVSPSCHTANTAAVNTFLQKVPTRMSYAAHRLPPSPVNSTAASVELAGQGLRRGLA